MGALNAYHNFLEFCYNGVRQNHFNNYGLKSFSKQEHCAVFVICLNSSFDPTHKLKHHKVK